MFVSLVAVQPEQEALVGRVLVVLVPLVLVLEVLVPLVPVLEALVQRKLEGQAELEVPVALVLPEVQEL
jgi:hypothetical protein